jgi:polyferredoxin
VLVILVLSSFLSFLIISSSLLLGIHIQYQRFILLLLLLMILFVILLLVLLPSFSSLLCYS